MKLSKDGKALMSLIATLRSEIAAKNSNGWVRHGSSSGFRCCTLPLVGDAALGEDFVLLRSGDSALKVTFSAFTPVPSKLS